MPKQWRLDKPLLYEPLQKKLNKLKKLAIRLKRESFDLLYKDSNPLFHRT